MDASGVMKPSPKNNVEPMTPSAPMGVHNRQFLVALGVHCIGSGRIDLKVLADHQITALRTAL
jgi:hypothetical protein